MNALLQAILAAIPPAFEALAAFIGTMATATYQLGVILKKTFAEAWDKLVADLSWYAGVAYNYGSEAVAHVTIARNNNFPGRNIILNTAWATLPIILAILAKALPTAIELCFYCILTFFRIVFQTRRIDSLFIRLFVPQGSPRYTRWLLQQGGLSNNHLHTRLYTSLVHKPTPVDSYKYRITSWLLAW